MTLAQFLKVPGFTRPIVDKQGHLLREYKEFLDELVKSVNANSGFANTDISTAQTQADFSGYRGLGQNFVWHSDDTGTQPPNNDTRDLVATIYDENDLAIATRTLRGTYTTAADTIIVALQSTTGEPTTFALTDDGTASVFAVVTHTASGAKTTLSWSYVDETVAGGVPVSGGGK